MPMLAHANADAASQPPNLEDAATPCRAANTLDAANRFEILHDPLSGPAAMHGAMLQSSFLIPQPWSVTLFEQPRLGSNICHLPPSTAKARQNLSIGVCVCVKGAHCVPATGQRLPIPSTNWPIRPEYHFSRLVPVAGSGRPPASNGPGWLHHLDELLVHQGVRFILLPCVGLERTN